MTVSLFEEFVMVRDVVIAGAGPNGLMLACELRLAGVDPVVLERLSEPSPQNRANGLVGQVVRMLDRRGLYQPLAGESGPPQPMPAFFFGAVPMDLHTLDDNPFYLLPQTRIERVLAAPNDGSSPTRGFRPDRIWCSRSSGPQTGSRTTHRWRSRRCTTASVGSWARTYRCDHPKPRAAPAGPVDRRQYPIGRRVSRRPGAACRRRCPRGLRDRRAGTQPRPARRGQPRLETGGCDPWLGASRAAGHLRLRAATGR